MFFFYTLGVDEVDYSLYPKREHQLKFIAVYLEEAAKLRGTVWCDAASSLVQFEIIFNFQHIYNSVSFWSYWLWVSKINIYYRKSPFNPTPSNKLPPPPALGKLISSLYFKPPPSPGLPLIYILH